MIQIEEFEKTGKSRFRKLLLSIFAIGGLLFVHLKSGEPVSWPIAIGVVLVTWAFTSANSLEKLFASDFAAQIKGKIPSVKK